MALIADKTRSLAGIRMHLNGKREIVYSGIAWQQYSPVATSRQESVRSTKSCTFEYLSCTDAAPRPPSWTCGRICIVMGGRSG